MNVTILSKRPFHISLPVALRGDKIKNGQGDNGYIVGVVTELSLPVVRRVMCYHRLTGALLATTISSADGSYRFDDLIAGVKYYVTSVDESKGAVQYNAVTQDLITASEVAS